MPAKAVVNNLSVFFHINSYLWMFIGIYINVTTRNRWSILAVSVCLICTRLCSLVSEIMAIVGSGQLREQLWKECCEALERDIHSMCREHGFDPEELGLSIPLSVPNVASPDAKPMTDRASISDNLETPSLQRIPGSYPDSIESELPVTPELPSVPAATIKQRGASEIDTSEDESTTIFTPAESEAEPERLSIPNVWDVNILKAEKRKLEKTNVAEEHIRQWALVEAEAAWQRYLGTSEHQYELQELLLQDYLVIQEWVEDLDYYTTSKALSLKNINLDIEYLQRVEERRVR